MIGVLIIRWQSDLVYTKESILPVCDKPYHTNKNTAQNDEEIESLRNYAFIYTYVHTDGCLKGV